MSRVEDLLVAVDDDFSTEATPARLQLRVIGQAALFLQTGHDRGTRDSDVLETDQITGQVRTRLPDMVERFNAVERDYFLVEETEFELHPSVFR